MNILDRPTVTLTPRLARTHRERQLHRRPDAQRARNPRSVVRAKVRAASQRRGVRVARRRRDAAAVATPHATLAANAVMVAEQATAPQRLSLRVPHGARQPTRPVGTLEAARAPHRVPATLSKVGDASGAQRRVVPGAEAPPFRSGSASLCPLLA